MSSSSIRRFGNRHPRLKRVLVACLSLCRRLHGLLQRAYWRGKGTVFAGYWRCKRAGFAGYWQGKALAFRWYWAGKDLARGWFSRRGRAERLSAAGDWRRALVLWRRLARDENAPHGAVALAEYAQCCLRLERLAEARAAVERALRLAPGLALARKVLGGVAAEQKNWPLAAAQWRHVLDNLSPNVRGLSDSRERENGVAIGGGESLNAANAAELAEALPALATALIYTGEFTEAAELLQRLAALGGDGEGRAARLRNMMADLRFETPVAPGPEGAGNAAKSPPPPRWRRGLARTPHRGSRSPVPPRQQRGGPAQPIPPRPRHGFELRQRTTGVAEANAGFPKAVPE